MKLQADYPMGGLPDASTQTWGRLPNGTGPFGATTPTPGAENKM